ncbi:Peptidase C1A papain C-terminal domain-containing protein [Entamoeba marina]
METTLINHPDQAPPKTLRNCTFGLLVLVLIFQIPVMIFIFGSGYVTSSSYKEEATTIMNSAVADVATGMNYDEVSVTANPDSIPSSFMTPHQLPRYCQYDRGTCWAFATMGLLEQSYRANGIKKGFLNENEFVTFSAQAYAIDVMEQCYEHPEACPGKVGPLNSTEGGFVEWLYAFPTLYDKILPETACPYSEQNDGQWECEDKSSKQEKNPIKFDVTSIVVKRSISEVKNLLTKYNAPVGFDSSLIIGQHVIPTQGHESLRTFITTHGPCPTAANEECMFLPQHEMDPNGEFFIQDSLAESEGGHAMNIAGYNDDFVNKDGTKGAFVVRNSWLDPVFDSINNKWKFPDEKMRKRFAPNDDPSLHEVGDTPRNYYRGSHSADYILGKISEWDERTICPNANNIMNWDSCVNLATGPTKYGVKSNVDTTSACFNETFMLNYVKNYRRPMEFRCLNQFSDAVCNEEDVDGSKFFLVSKSQSIINKNLVNICMLRVNASDINQQSEFCMNDIPMDYVEFFFMPIQEHLNILVNDGDHCGYNIWPYSYIDKSLKYRGFFDVLHFDITWDDRSYIKNKDNNKNFDYQYVDDSTNTQTPVPFFYGPEPYQERFYE